MARYSVYQVRPLIRALKEAFAHKGFAFVEVISTCPTQYGRRNDPWEPAAMLRYWKDRCVTMQRAEQLSAQELAGKTVIGRFVPAAG